MIIKTPQPDREERLVVVPPGACREPQPGEYREPGCFVVTTGAARDATPEDLERAGYVLESGANTIVEEHLARAEKAERERDDLLEGDMREARTQRERADQAERELDEARAEPARLTAPAEGEPSGADLRAIVDREGLRIGVDAALVALWRDGAAHERAWQQPAQDRATDEELERAYSVAYARAWESELSTPDRGERAGIRAVAARVRGERCLVTRAVAANVDIRVCEDDGGGFLVGVHAPDCDEDLERNVPAADVPATLARLLGEVERG